MIRRSKYLERITFFYPYLIMSMVDLEVIRVEKLNMDNGCSWKKEFIELICTNLLIILYLSINQVYSYYNCVCGP